MTLANQLKTARDKTQLSLPKAAKLIGIPKSALFKMETGDHLNPSWNTLAKLGKFYKITFKIP